MIKRPLRTEGMLVDWYSLCPPLKGKLIPKNEWSLVERMRFSWSFYALPGACDPADLVEETAELGDEVCWVGLVRWNDEAVVAASHGWEFLKVEKRVVWKHRGDWRRFLNGDGLFGQLLHGEHQLLSLLPFLTASVAWVPCTDSNW